MSTITVAAVEENLETVHEFITKYLSAAGFKPKITRQVLLAAEEVFINIVRYSGSGQVEISLETSGRAVLVTFADNGTPFNPLNNNDPNIHLMAKERALGGLGIYITKKITDGVEYEYTGGKNVLRFKKNNIEEEKIN